MRRDAIEAVFGPRALGHALFYQHELSLRFELGLGGGHLAQFTSAFDRGRRVLDLAFEGVERLVLVLAGSGAQPSVSLRLMRQLKRLDVELSRPYDSWVTPAVDEDGEDGESRRVLSFEIPIAHQHRVLFGVAAAELGVSPSLGAEVYLLAPELGVLAHPYDDRGMDIIGPNRKRLRGLYDALSPMLLDHDRPAMKRGIGSWTDDAQMP